MAKEFDVSKIKIVALDLDGTLTQHRTEIGDENKKVLDELGKRYKLIMVGAGTCSRIWKQLRYYPIDIIGGYGMEYCKYNFETKSLDTVFSEFVPCNKESVLERAKYIREKYGFTNYKGDSVVFHPSGFVTFAILGGDADIKDKLAFDPTREKRRKIYDNVCKTFPEFYVMVGGSSSFDMTPNPYNKKYALERFAKDNNLSHDNIAYIGDDYGKGGNDESVYNSDFPFVTVDDYTSLYETLKGKLL